MCGSAEFRKDRNGFLLCSQGHQQDGYWEEQDEFDPSYGGVRRSAHARDAPRQSRTSHDVPDDVVRLGDVDGFTIHRAFQAILKAQLAALRAAVPLPDSFDSVVRECWLRWVTAAGLSYDEEREGCVEQADGPLAGSAAQVHIVV